MTANWLSWEAADVGSTGGSAWQQFNVSGRPLLSAKQPTSGGGYMGVMPLPLLLPRASAHLRSLTNEVVTSLQLWPTWYMGVMPVPPAIIEMWRATCGSPSRLYLQP